MHTEAFERGLLAAQAERNGARINATSSPYPWTSREHREWSAGLRYGRALAQA